MNKIVDQLKTSQAARVAYWVALVFSIFIFTLGFFVPPMGEISGSVLIAGGSVMLFTLAYIAVAYRANVRLDVDLDDRKISLSSADKKGGEDA